jgi:hypothetical protein
MLRSSVVITSLVLSSVASAFSGNFTANVNQDVKNEKTKEAIGLAVSHGFGHGFGWWSWTGMGTSYKDNKELDKWYQTNQGIDLTIKRIRIGGTAKFEYNENIKEVLPEYGMRINVKLW